MRMLIAGDIGGTKTLLALFDQASGPREPLTIAKFRSADYADLAAMVRQFLAEAEARAEYACFDVAGPVVGGRAQLTNLPWALDEETLRRDLGLRRVTLVNDLNAVAVSVPHLRPEELHTINPGTPEPLGPLAVVAPGTGLGEAFLVWDGQTYLPCASEGGHADFAPANELQDGLLRFMRERFGHVPYERVCSGSGLQNLYDFLQDAGYADEPPEFAAKLAEATDGTPLLVQAAVDDPEAHPLATAAVTLFISILGAETGNLALKVLATGGVYLAGGMPGHLIPQLEDGGFMDAFVAKGRFADRLATTPVQVITTRAALLGAAIYGLEHMGPT
jgi:glucokinase